MMSAVSTMAAEEDPAVTEESCEITQHVAEFIEKELGNDPKSLKKLSQITEELALYKKTLEEQVRRPGLGPGIHLGVSSFPKMRP